MEIEITKKLLHDYKKLKKEIVLLNSEISEMQHNDFGVGSSIIIDQRKKVLEEKIIQVAAVDEWIENMEDDLARIVFKMFYQKDYSWEKISRCIGCVASKDYARLHVRDKYLKNSGIK